MIRGARQRGLACQCRGDAGAVAAGDIRVDLERLLDQRDRRLGVVVLEERPAQRRRAGRAQLVHEVPALRQFALVAGRHQQVPPALAPVGTGQAEVGHPAEPDVVDDAERQWRRLDHQRPLGDIQVDPEIDRVRIRGQEQRLRIHQLRPDEGRVVRDAGLLEALEDGRHRSALVGIHERLDAVHQVEIVVDLGHGLLARRAVLVFQACRCCSRPCQAW